MQLDSLRRGLVESLESRRLFSVFTVTTAADSGAGSLRQAILDANAHPGTDTINFNINGGGAAKIAVNSVLPNITEALGIDGTSQPGYAGKPLIELSGELVATPNGGASIGILITASNSGVNGLVINRFSGTGVFIGAGVQNTSVLNCYLGTTADGSAGAGNVTGVYLASFDFSLFNNVVSGNGVGVVLDRASNPGGSIFSNYIGTDASGLHAVPNGIGIDAYANAEIGHESSQYHLGNIISGNLRAGIRANANGGSTTLIQGNKIGVDVNGNGLGNLGPGLEFTTLSPDSRSQYSLSDNVIAYNGDAGVRIAGSSPLRRVMIQSNSIFSNQGLGIDLGDVGVTANDAGDLDAGPNDLLNAPVLQSYVSGASGPTVTFSYDGPANSDIRLSFFANDTTAREGKTYLGMIPTHTDAFGYAALSTLFWTSPLPGQFITATASLADPINGGGVTSEFSNPLMVPLPVTAPAAPTSMVAKAISGSQVNLTWLDNATNEGGYEIQRSAVSTFANAVSFKVSTPNAVTYSDTTLSKSTYYYYRVRAFNAAGNSTFSNSLKIKTLATGGSTPTPTSTLAAPGSLTGKAQAGGTSMLLNWADLSTGETGIEIQISSTFDYQSVRTIRVTAADLTNYLVTGLSKSTYYYFRVRTFNDLGTSAFSNSVKVKSLSA